jgi:3-hydroxybutyryl-CoA dehydrogenase
MDFDRIAVVGAGQMGTGIAQVSAQTGIDVILMDISSEAIEKARKEIADAFERKVAKGGMTEGEATAALARITFGADYAALSDCQLAIEAVIENEETKVDVLKSICPVVPPDCIIGSNTSTVSITRLAARTDRPGRFIGTHFMKPVAKMGLVELIRGIATEEATYSALHDFILRLGKTPISAEDFPAFVVNRILMPMINESIYTLYEGVGTVENIDCAMRLGTHHPMGPLELADFIGLDTCHGIMQTMFEGLGDSKYRPCPLLVKYVEAGWLGRKTGRGFYDYSGDVPTPTR